MTSIVANLQAIKATDQRKHGVDVNGNASLTVPPAQTQTGPIGAGDASQPQMWPPPATIAADKNSDGRGSADINSRKLRQPKLEATEKFHSSSQLSRANNTNQISINSPIASKFKVSAEEPLVHTEQLNTTSGLLFINPTRTQDNQEAAETTDWTSRVAILSATYSPHRRIGEMSANLYHAPGGDSGSPEPEIPLTLAEGAFSRIEPTTELVPRLVVLNLEVASSSATLTWNFGLYPATKTAPQSGANNDSPERRSSEPINKSVNSAMMFKRSTRDRRDTMRARPTSTRNKEANVSNGGRGSGAELTPEAAPSNNDDDDQTTKTESENQEPREASNGDNLTVSKRLRLSQIQSLPAGQSHRRPPTRPAGSSSTTTTTQEPISEISFALGEEAPEMADEAEQEDPLTSTTSTTTTTTSTTTTAKPAHKVIISKPPKNLSKAVRSNRTKSTDAPMIRTPSIPLNRLQSSTTKVPFAVSRREPKALVDATPNAHENVTSAEPSTITIAPAPPTTTSTTTTVKPTTASTQTGGGAQPEVESSSKTMSVSSPVVVSRQSLVTSPTTTSTRPNRKSPVRARESKWLVRLRRFGSNEIDIVKVIINNTNMERASRPNLRYISFKNLQPASAYELCVESASPNQQVGDSYQILNANHFLKCHDTSDVVIANVTSEFTDLPEENKLKRMDLRAEFSEMSSVSKVPEVGLPVAMPLVTAASTATSAGPETPGVKVKSLCREFFTLPLNAPIQRLNFGMADDFGNSSTEALKNRTLALVSQNLRKPKSLNNVLRSRMEVLEIAGGEDRGNTWFEMAASTPVRVGANRLAPIASDNNFNVLRGIENPPEPSFELNRPSNNNYLTMSLFPILGCVFGLIFILTLANMILNAITCRRAANRQRIPRRQPIKSYTSPLGGGHRRSSFGPSPTPTNQQQIHKQTLASFYSDSDHSGTSKSRIVVVGKNGDPFAATSGYFEFPMENSGPKQQRTTTAEQSSLEASGSGGRHSSANLLVSSARFPLGPSFEGDERHNADMVGLARKNYENFISNIYGRANSISSLTDQENSPPGSAGLLPVATNKSRASHHKHRHQHHRRPVTNNRLQLDQQEEEEEYEKVSTEQQQAEPTYASSSDKRQRLRFDKINPIYNMDSFYATAGPKSTSQFRSSVSTFGHSVATISNLELAPSGNSSQLNLEPSSERKSVRSNNSDNKCCPACQYEQEAQLVQASREDSLEQCDGENCDDGSFYTCCLDRQKQRFHKQQQQLERVMTKNGSLVPQPFINPAGPSDLPYGDLEPATSQLVGTEESNREQQEVAVASSLGECQAVSETAARSPPPPPPPPPETPVELKFGSDDTMPNAHTKSVTLPPSGNTKSEPMEPRQLSNSSQSTTKRAPHKSGTSDGNTLINIQSMGGATIDDKGRLRGEKLEEAINKEDFNQRRKELANKLNLVGMSKPS